MTVFPAYAGVIPINFCHGSNKKGVSRVCGGDPKRESVYKKHIECFPRMRG